VAQEIFVDLPVKASILPTKFSGLSTTNKKHKNFQNSEKMFRPLKIPQIFQIVFLLKILRKSVQKFSQLAALIKTCQTFFLIY
jgi:hypothetical protein